MIIAAPGIKPGTAEGLVGFINLLPTVADFCGVKPPTGLVGHSLRPLLEDPSAAGRPAAFTIVTRGRSHRGDSIRTDRWRYTEWSDSSRELYDHSSDPEETRNLVSDPQQNAVTRELSEKLAAHNVKLEQ